MQTNSSVWQDCGITGKPANKSRQPLWLKESKWTPQHPPPSWVPGVCDDCAWPMTTPLATYWFFPAPNLPCCSSLSPKQTPTRFLATISGSRCQSQLESHHICHMKFFQQWERKHGSTNTSKRPEEKIAKVTPDKEMDWYSQTSVLPLLYPTPTRDCLCASPQLSASSRELKLAEPGLCYVCRVPNPRMPWSSTETPSGTGQARFSTCVAPICALPLAPYFHGLFWLGTALSLQCNCPKNNAARFPNHSGIVTVIQEDVSVQLSKQPQIQIQYKIHRHATAWQQNLPLS